MGGGGHNSRCFFCLQVDGLITGGTGGELSLRYPFTQLISSCMVRKGTIFSTLQH